MYVFKIAHLIYVSETYYLYYNYRKPAEEPEEPSNGTPDDAGEDASSTADVKDPTEYEQVFKPKTSLGKIISETFIAEEPWLHDAW